jgi:hypothetical protein
MGAPWGRYEPQFTLSPVITGWRDRHMRVTGSLGKASHTTHYGGHGNVLWLGSPKT